MDERQIELWDDDPDTGQMLTVDSIRVVAGWMGIRTRQLRGFLMQDGYCLVDDPQIRYARPYDPERRYPDKDSWIRARRHFDSLYHVTSDSEDRGRPGLYYPGDVYIYEPDDECSEYYLYWEGEHWTDGLLAPLEDRLWEIYRQGDH